MKLGQRGAVEASALLTGMVALILVYALAPTIVSTSENAALTFDTDRFPDDETDNSTYPAKGAQPIFRLGPLFWALVGIGVAASIVIGSLRVRG